jgi:hypothetical protein
LILVVEMTITGPLITKNISTPTREDIVAVFALSHGVVSNNHAAGYTSQS